MATPTLIATPMASDANSYCTVAEADLYHAAHLYAAVWEDADASQKTVALIWATRLLDEQVDWVGTKATEAQALRWPRTDVEDRDGYLLASTVIPNWLKNATAELARQLLAKDRLAVRDDAMGGIKSVSAGSVSVEFDAQDRIQVFPESVQSLIDWYSLGTQGGYEVPLVRV